jgi:two-component system, OmpR family, phosphate regulon sensor histidine kinase PhoR
MVSVELLIGLTVGLGICVWQHYRWRKRLKDLINSFSSQEDRSISLPPIYLVRREIEHLEQERKKVTQERDNWQILIDRAPIGYLLVDEENQLLWCNQQARILLKLDRWRWGEVRLLLELVRSYELDRLIERTRKSQQPQEKEWIFYFTRHASAKGQNLASLETSATSLKAVNAIAISGHSFPLPDRQVGVFLINRQPIVDLSSSRDRAVSDLAHELKTPLTSISLVAENLLNRLQNPERRWVEQMLKETNRLITLVREWLDLTQLEADPTKVLKYEEIILQELISSVWQTLEPIAKKKNITLTLMSHESLTIEGDRSRLIQVFLNLLDNAIKHSPVAGEIVVNINCDRERENTTMMAAIDIIDSGKGFVASDLPYVFDRLYRGEHSRTRIDRESGGSGLGLAIVQQIVQAHEGLIEAKNHLDLGGAWLRIKLPIARIKKVP